jgi:sucrose-6-phosphate hydrolase SacC (GH32 family)
MVQSGATRRLVFGFTGWQEPTMPSGCGRALIIARELTVEGSELVIHPIPETSVLRVPPAAGAAPALQGAVDDGDAFSAAGSRVELRLNCTVHGAAAPSAGKVGVRTLATADGRAYTEIGYDFGVGAFYADHSACCAKANTIVQRAPLPLAGGGAVLALTAFVDGGLIEAFLNGKVITPLVAPDAAAGMPVDRVSTVTNTAGAGVTCAAASWALQY